LFAICRARRIPLFTFINKLDRPARDPLELLDELENVLGIGAYPVNWPLGNGDTFRGVYDRTTRAMHVFERTEHGAKRAPVTVSDVRDERIRALVDEGTYRDFIDGLELLEGAGADFDAAAMLRGDVTPVFFGSAVTNFGVELFLERFIELAPSPGPRADAQRNPIEPTDERFSAFVFKIQANMDPRHRDRVAFARICSGRFERDMTVRNARTGKDVRLTRAMKLFANDRESVDVAYAGDVVGLANPGSFAIGDTLAEGDGIRFDSIPAFEPEHFALVRSIDTASYKSFQKGLAQLSEEGAIQVFYPYGQTRVEPILAAVGALQFEVVKYRLESEYNVKTALSHLPYTLARRAVGDHSVLLAAQLPSNARLVEDWDGHPLALFESEWSLRLASEWNPSLTFEPFGARDLAATVAS
jgi:peptide chain release factor 3